jgi:hypothetical protein
MAYKSCAAQIAANIAQDCNRPLVGGYTGRAVIIPANDFAKAEVVVDANNPRKIMSIVLPPDGSVMAYTIDNVFATPFTGSTTAGNNESGRNGYLKTLAVRIPMRGADVSRDVIEPLVKDADGFVVIAEKRDKVGDGSYEVIGYQNALRGDIASVTRDESANGGDWLVNLTTVEKWAEVTLVGSADTYESAKKEFEGLFGFEPIITRMVLTEDSEGQVQLSANGLVIVEYIQDGAKVRNTYSALSDTYVLIPIGVDATIYGAITAINSDGNESVFSSLDLSKNTALTYLDCNGSTGLTSLDLSKDTALTYLGFNGCTGLMLLDIQNTSALEGGVIIDQSMANLTTLQVAGTSEWAYEQVESWLSDYAPDGGMIYVDENTPQSVITEAEGKEWKVIYQA